VALFSRIDQRTAAPGHSDAGTRVAGWLAEAGFERIDPGGRAFSFEGGEVAAASYVADVAVDVIPVLAQLPGTASEAELRVGLDDLRALAAAPDAQLGWIVHKAGGRSLRSRAFALKSLREPLASPGGNTNADP
jgi:hypothetical protein